jgi:hypothetical protein
MERGRGALLALYGLGILAALLMSAIALADSGGPKTPNEAAVQASATPSHALDVTIRPESKLGPDGKKHDAYSRTEFAVKAGRPLTLRIDNTDAQPHSITSTAAGVQIIALPGTHEYSLLVKNPGRYPWRCMIVCDNGANGWAMTHAGYMSGYITAT